MTQTVVWTCDKSTVTRVKVGSSAYNTGCGGSDSLLVGRKSGYEYTSYAHFAASFTDMGRIVSATLTLTTDEGLESGFPIAGTTDAPRITVYDLNGPFSEGNNADGHFDSSDYTYGAIRTGTGVTGHMAKAADSITNIDVTAIVKSWAPSSVTGGGRKTQYGLKMIRYNTSEASNWSGWSRHASDAGTRPFITVVYELGPTTPNTPGNAAPSGSVVSIGAFEADFSDPRSTDTLDRTQVQVYNSTAKSGTAGTNDVITSNGHGLSNGQTIWFHSLTGGAGLSLAQPYYVRDKATNTFKVAATAGGAAVNITTAYSALTFASPLWDLTKIASDTEIVNARSFVTPDGLSISTDVTYYWRCRQRDQESQWSGWMALTSFSVSNTNPNEPTGATPADSFTTDTLTGVLFRTGTFSDPDAGDFLSAFQCQMSAYGAGNPNWDDPAFLIWDTGKMYVASGTTEGETVYTGESVAAGTYYWRVRVWDQNDGVSVWHYNQITLTSDFDADPASTSSIQINRYAPWRVRIREMNFDTITTMTASASTDLVTCAAKHGFSAGRRIRFTGLTGGTGLVAGQDYYVMASGLTATAFKVATTLNGSTAVDITVSYTGGTVTAIKKRGPGNILAVIDNAKSSGAAIAYNSPGEFHFTLPHTHPQITVINPWQVHYGLDFYTGDGWKETFSGLIFDFDAIDSMSGDIIFKGIDYLGLLDLVLDERYDPSQPDRAYNKGGSYYSNQTIRTVVVDQLTRASALSNSPVGFITLGSIATMNEKVSIYSTMQPVLGFIGGLLDSHRAGTQKKTRIQVKRTTTGGYQFVVTDDPGTTRDNLRLAYGELVQGYHVIPFGKTWASVMHGIGRTREGIRVLYKTQAAPGVDQTVWGRIARAVMMDNVSDETDLIRRLSRAAIKASKVGQQIGIAIRNGLIQPLSGFDICDDFPVTILDGPIDTDNFGSGYWTVYALAWEAQDDGSAAVIPTLLPRDDQTPADPDLLDAVPISPQDEWQIGWTPPDPTIVTAKRFLDQSTGVSYERDDSATGISVTGSSTT